MNEYYTINHIVLMTGLTDRTIRNYIRMGLLQGEMINGMWHFTADQFSSFISHPSVAPSIRAKRHSLVYDFLLDERKQNNELCTVLDISAASLPEANAISEFFCDAINRDFADSIRFNFSYQEGRIRIILSGQETSMLELLSRYHQRA